MLTSMRYRAPPPQLRCVQTFPKTVTSTVFVCVIDVTRFYTNTGVAYAL